MLVTSQTTGIIENTKETNKSNRQPAMTMSGKRNDKAENKNSAGYCTVIFKVNAFLNPLLTKNRFFSFPASPQPNHRTVKM